MIRPACDWTWVNWRACSKTGLVTKSGNGKWATAAVRNGITIEDSAAEEDLTIRIAER
jgi:hypothetical protein